jgi:hypothetical protein
MSIDENGRHFDRQRKKVSVSYALSSERGANLHGVRLLTWGQFCP